MKFSRFVYALERNGENYAKKSPPLNQKQDKILGGLFGLLIGDALGVPYEFYPPEQLPAYQDIEMQPPGRPLGRHGKLEQTKSYEESVKRAVYLGNDTDTTACITGGLTGIFYGFSSIPERWISMLKERNRAEELFQKLLCRRETENV